jgi:ribosomal protein S18 acetylase RimI-like enzyme
VIRLANKDDTEAIAYVVSTAQKTWVTWAGAELQLYDVAQLSEQWSQRIDDLTTISFVYTDARGHVVAVASAGPEALSFKPSSTSPDSAHLSTLFALPDFHGSEAAQDLHDHLLSALTAKRYCTVRLWVPRDADRARRFYARNGWAATGVQTHFAGLLRTELRRSI